MEKIDHNTKVEFPKQNPNSKTSSTRSEKFVIGQGAERVAHPSTDNKTGKHYVLKKPLNADDPILTDKNTCQYIVATYNCAEKFCAAFNEKFPEADSMEFVKTDYVRDADIPIWEKKQRYFIHEKYLDGAEFEKWNNNVGMINTKHKEADIQAFAHFVYHYTKGNRMVLDLQGMYYTALDKYVLTDPAFISNTPCGGVCGPTDFGNHAIYNFFTQHDYETCQKMKCKDLLRPDLSKLEKAPLGELLGQEGNRNAKNTQSLTRQQTYKNTGKAILLNPRAVKQSLKVSDILGMANEHKSYLKLQLGAIAEKAPEKISVPIFNQLEAIDEELAPAYEPNTNPKGKNETGLTKEQLEQIASDW